MSQKTLVITGGSRGIGHAAIHLFIENGWRVINLSRSKTQINGVHDLSVDLQSPEWEAEAAKELDSLISKTCTISLVHNAGITWSDTVLNLEIEKLKLMLNINLFAAIALNQILIKKMGEGSSIIYIGSTLSEKGVPNSASYTISKHALAGLMKATCQDLYPFPNIHTCCICPGFTETEMLRNLITEQGFEIVAKKVSKKRLILPKEIAELIYHCALNPIINGSIIHANLGHLES